MQSGKHVVTANKALIAARGAGLAAEAEKWNLALNFEAAAAGGIPIVKALREETDKVLAEAIAKDPLTRKVHESYFAFKAKFDRWSEISEEQYHVKVRG